MTKISAEIIADSINEQGDRITSFVIVLPRIVLAEFNTHRMLSRNSASSRAIPFEKMLKRVQEEPFIPIKFQKDHSGMQGTEYFEGEEAELIKHEWLMARDSAVTNAKILAAPFADEESGLTKQLCNRLLEPFMYHTIIATATEWSNFMALRAHPAAEIHIAHAAHLMLEEMNASTPKLLKAGEWHIPFGDKMDENRISEFLFEKYGTDDMEDERKGVSIEKTKIMIATARCARVSYMNYEGGDDYGKDITLHDKLSSVGHWSCFEHCARAMNEDEYNWLNATSGGNSIGNGWSGNFKGFVQYRKTFEGENKSDDRLLAK